MNLINSIESLNKIIDSYFVKSTFTNNYLLSDAYSQYIAENRIFSVLTKSNACILIEKEGFDQLYYYINDFSELLSMPSGKPVVMEILYRGENQKPQGILEYWKNCGFKPHLTRDTMILSYPQAIFPVDLNEKVEIKYAESDKEIIFTQKIIEETFDKYTGDILTLNKAKYFVANRHVICAYLDGNLCGVLQFEIKNNQVYLGHLAVSSYYRGKGIANALVKAYIVDNASRLNAKYYLWVVQDNKTAIALYQKFGFVYGNKSSVSLLKE